MKQLFVVALILQLVGCTSPYDPVAAVLASENPRLKNVFDSLKKHEVQFIFTEVQRTNGSDEVDFKEEMFQVDDTRYFYPASTVKFPMAIFALEKMNAEGLIHRNTTCYIEGDSIETTMAKEIEKIFAVSDNDAYNRLFEYVGQDYINQRLAELQIKGRIFHRLSVEDSDNITTKPIIYYLNDSTTATTVPIINKPNQPLSLSNLTKGVGYYEDGEFVKKPKDFSLKNYLPVTSLHMLMKRLFFPKNYPENEQFQLSDSDREFIVKAMRILPRQAGYTTDEYYDAYGKFLIYGDRKEDLPATVEIRNKVGSAYGYLTDCAYIIDKVRQKEYLITATVYVNENQLFNDDQYEYDSVGIPFLAELGRVLIGE